MMHFKKKTTIRHSVSLSRHGQEMLNCEFPGDCLSFENDRVAGHSTFRFGQFGGVYSPSDLRHLYCFTFLFLPEELLRVGFNKPN